MKLCNEHMSLRLARRLKLVTPKGNCKEARGGVLLMKLTHAGEVQFLLSKGFTKRTIAEILEVSCQTLFS